MLETEQIHDRLIDIPNELLEKGKEYATKKSNYDLLDEQRKIILSIEMSKFNTNYIEQHRGKQPPEWKCRAAAYMSKEYVNHLEALEQTQKDYLKCQAEVNALNAEFEAKRSVASYKKNLQKKV